MVLLASLALVAWALVLVPRLPFPRDVIVGGTIAATFAYHALFLELCERRLDGWIWLGGPALLLLDAGVFLYLVAKTLADLRNPDAEPPDPTPPTSWSCFVCALALIGAALAGASLQDHVYFRLHSAHLESLVREEPERPRVVRSVGHWFNHATEFVYDPTHGKDERIWYERLPFGAAQHLGGPWYARIGN